MRLIVYKSKKILEVWKDGKLTKTYKVGVGKNPGHKEVEGDLRTPEGEYQVVIKNPKSKYHLSFGVNYPNNKDAKAALEKGNISQEEFEKICELNNAGAIPLWKTKIGGEIYIHGHLEKQDWTHGCVRMNDADISELYPLINIGDEVIFKA